ncbi:hypothetical protein [Altererythrobacter sp. ZODW24]|uniref:hypothetical protein n=1 Tax=Altererythrobacter sp. ZODW24 TaxID=2185142 RepID=UPI001F07D4F2|nr:hypothetical protein [Altererythrobacter sp. ZODW24]
MVRFLAVALAALAVSIPVSANDSVELVSSVFVESAPAQNGFRSVAPASTLSRGDKVVLLVKWAAPRDRRSFKVSARVPASLAFQRSGSDALEVSTDGGKSWGQLGTMKVGGTRLASPEDVTHLRWTISRREAARGSGRIAYSALVR